MSDIPVVLCRITKYKQNIVKHNSVDDFIKVYFLRCFFQRHVSTLVISHLKVYYFFLVRQNIQLELYILLYQDTVINLKMSHN